MNPSMEPGLKRKPSHLGALLPAPIKAGFLPLLKTCGDRKTILRVLRYSALRTPHS